jgi:DNA-binding LytR/AlgR family response regulator
VSDDVTAPPPQFWLRDGRTSILIDPCEITSVISAGNYVEFQLTGLRNHLIRTTLQAQEARLAPFGIARVHRSRLVNLRRIVALEWRASGDFELRLDSGETVAGSRRFKAAVAGIAG